MNQPIAQGLIQGYRLRIPHPQDGHYLGRNIIYIARRYLSRESPSLHGWASTFIATIIVGFYNAVYIVHRSYSTRELVQASQLFPHWMSSRNTYTLWELDT